MKKLVFIIMAFLFFLSCEKEELVPMNFNKVFIEDEDVLMLTQDENSFNWFSLEDTPLEWNAIVESYEGKDITYSTTYKCFVQFVGGVYVTQMTKISGSENLSYQFTLNGISVQHTLRNTTNSDFILVRLTTPKAL